MKVINNPSLVSGAGDPFIDMSCDVIEHQDCKSN